MFLEGIEMIFKSTQKLLKKHGVQEIQVKLNEPANFQFHNVIFVAPNPSLPDNTIIHISEKGYMIQDRVLRAAKVGVVKNS